MFDFWKKKNLDILAPFGGEVVLLDDLADPVFSGHMVGDGFAVRPPEGHFEVLAPVTGRVEMIFPTGHAFGIKMADGFEVLVHLGLDTVELRGEGFEQLVQVGDEVQAGTPVIRMDSARIAVLGRDAVSPVVFTAVDRVLEVKPKLGPCTAGAVVARVKLA